jgi:hypothetical protein
MLRLPGQHVGQTARAFRTRLGPHKKTQKSKQLKHTGKNLIYKISIDNLQMNDKNTDTRNPICKALQ